MIRVNFLSLEVVVGVIKRSAVGLQRLGSQNGVVHHAFHTVAVPRLLSHTQQVAGQLEVSVRAAWRFKTAVAVREAGIDVVTIGSTKALIGSPASGRETLRG